MPTEQKCRPVIRQLLSTGKIRSKSGARSHKYNIYHHDPITTLEVRNLAGQPAKLEFSLGSATKNSSEWRHRRWQHEYLTFVSGSSHNDEFQNTKVNITSFSAKRNTSRSFVFHNAFSFFFFNLEKLLSNTWAKKKTFMYINIVLFFTCYCTWYRYKTRENDQLKITLSEFVFLCRASALIIYKRSFSWENHRGKFFEPKNKAVRQNEILFKWRKKRFLWGVCFDMISAIKRENSRIGGLAV